MHGIKIIIHVARKNLLPLGDVPLTLYSCLSNMPAKISCMPAKTTSIMTTEIILTPIKIT